MVTDQLDPLWFAISKLRRGKYEDCVTICNSVLSTNPGDQVCHLSSFFFFIDFSLFDANCLKSQAIWVVKCNTVIKQNFLDDLDLDGESVAEMILDENALTNIPRYTT